MWLLIVIGISVVSLIIFIGPEKLAGNFKWVEFYSKGSDAGFSFNDIRLLWKASRLAELENPSGIFWSVDVLDQCINEINNDFRISQTEDKETLEELLVKLYDYRKKVEFDKPRYKTGIRSTRDIPLQQVIKLRVNNIGIYTCKVHDNTEEGLLVTYPDGDPLPQGFSWRDDIELNVYFWRKNDAGYFFQTTFDESYKDSDSRFLRMKHSNDLLRSQKRRSVRASSKLTAQLYPLKNLDQTNHLVETRPGVSCLVIDISEDGAAIRVGGRGKKGWIFKLQFKIKDESLVVNGIVKSVDYQAELDQSLLHLEIVEPDEETKMRILAYVYDIDRSRVKEVMAEQMKKDQEEAMRAASGESTSEEIPGEAAESEKEAPVDNKTRMEAEKMIKEMDHKKDEILKLIEGRFSELNKK